jgi:putative toxin-antitoxin system antitoxin component (TIGR02293 family)
MEPLKRDPHGNEPIDDTGSSIGKLQRQLGLSSGELAAPIGVSARTLERWRSGIYVVPQGETKRRLQNLFDLQQQLHDVIADDSETREWLSTRRAFLGNLTPIEVIRAGRADRVQELLTSIEHGIHV